MLLRPYSSEPHFLLWIYLIVAYKSKFKILTQSVLCLGTEVAVTSLCTSFNLRYLLANQVGWSRLCRALRILIWRCYFSESKPAFGVVRWVISHLPQLYLLSWSRMRCAADVTQSCNSENSTRYSRKTDSPALTPFRARLCFTISKLKVTPLCVAALKKSLQKLIMNLLREELFIIFSHKYFCRKEKSKA